MIIYIFREEIAMGKSTVSVVAALDSKRGIGKNNDLLFKIPEDFDRMKRLTIGHPLIMGRKTFESIGRVLPGRTNIVITRDEANFSLSHPEFISGSRIPKQVRNDKNAILASQGQALEGYVVNSLEGAIEIAKKPHPGPLLKGEGTRNQLLEEIFIFGGGQVFKEAIEKGLVDRLYLTIVEGDFGADTFFPDYSEFDKIIHEEGGQSGEYKFKFLDLGK
ncbi:MAG: dihydrofolate reductase [Candidatus Levybacteria bacterium]|nr:dihydrofolate reductase [Candidatus Levybacteria bacterium]